MRYLHALRRYAALVSFLLPGWAQAGVHVTTSLSNFRITVIDLSAG